MTSPFERLKALLRESRAEIDRDLAEGRSRLRYRMERGRAVFDTEIRDAHRAIRERLPGYILHARPRVVLTAPVIYGLIVPFAALDLCVAVYQAICFPVYGIARVRRADHIIIDRHRLAYLNGLQKLNCLYCGYVNGVISLVREVAARTEQYWCPIRHAVNPADPHDRYGDFSEYGDAEDFRSRNKALRDELRPDRTPPER